jgi:FkbM family methyltransferase
MGIKRTLKKIAEKVTGTHIFREMPFGISITHDIFKRFPGYSMNVIFDVGANIGQSALSYVSMFPSATIHCFEPIKETFEQLRRNVEGKNQVHCYNFALADSAGKGTMISKGTSTMNCLVHEEDDNAVKLQETEQVQVSTLDDFCKANKINKISYLKVDTEGGDLNVLIGSKDILNRHGVDIVEVEAGMNPSNKHHVAFESLKEFLESHGYFIFGIYEQVSEWPKKEPHLRRTNTVFVSENMIRAYSGR